MGDTRRVNATRKCRPAGILPLRLLGRGEGWGEVSLPRLRNSYFDIRTYPAVSKLDVLHSSFCLLLSIGQGTELASARRP